MGMRQKLRMSMFVISIALAALWGTARAGEIPLVNGELWIKSSEQVKKSYLIGIANLAQVETAYFGSNPPPDTQSFVPRMVRGMKGQSLNGVLEALDHWYAAHPDQMQRPVLETIWFELVVPGLQRAQ